MGNPHPIEMAIIEDNYSIFRSTWICLQDTEPFHMISPAKSWWNSGWLWMSGALGDLRNFSWFDPHSIPILLLRVPEVLLAQSPGARTLTTQAIGGQIFCKLHLPTMIAIPQKDTNKCFQEGSSMIFKSLRSDKMMMHIYIYTYYIIYIFIYHRVSGVQRSIYVGLAIYQAYPAQS